MAIVWYIASTAAEFRKLEFDMVFKAQKETNDLLSKCVVPQRGGFKVQSDETRKVDLPPLRTATEGVMEIAPSSIIKHHSVVIHGHKTSVSLEPEFWNLLKMIAKGRKMGIGDLLGQIDGERTGINLSSWIRLFVLDHVMQRVALQNPTEETMKRR